MDQQHPEPGEIGGTGSVASKPKGAEEDEKTRREEAPPTNLDEENSDASVVADLSQGPSAGTGM